jgi:hypothetical protein
MKTKVVQMAIRILALTQLVLGIIVWGGNADGLIIPHVMVGSLLTIGLFIITYRAFRAGIPKWIVIIAAVWDLGLPLYGILQTAFFPEPNHLIAEVLHLLCALGAVGISEYLASKLKSS